MLLYATLFTVSTSIPTISYAMKEGDDPQSTEGHSRKKEKEKEAEGNLGPHGCSIQINKAIKAMGGQQCDVVICCD